MSVATFSLDIDDDALKALLDDLGTGLSLDEGRRIRDHFVSLGREASDIELQAIGQAWSEHCCYKSSFPLLKKYLFGLDHPDLIDRGDAGVMRFDDDHVYSLRIESHNHPSAVEPYGGAATGIGGILRDILCMGTRPIALTDPLFFAPRSTPEEDIPPGTRHPAYLQDGVVAGIRDYGNRVGVPTVSGGLWLDPLYLTNPLVNVGCVGFGKTHLLKRNRVESADDVFLLCGGATGRDGIHGVNFASEVLTEASETESRGAVQLGDPITKEPVIQAILEALPYISGMKDLGGGGLSCVIGEMALDGGYGAVVDLEKVPLKEQGLEPWEIWVSESQERMMLAVKPDDLPRVKEILDLYDVHSVVVGRCQEERKVTIRWEGTVIGDLEIGFQTAGPVYDMPMTTIVPNEASADHAPLPLRETLLSLLADENIRSREGIIHQYDHQVGARTVLPPIHGLGPGDAAVMRPLRDGEKGLAITTAAQPWATSRYPYRGGMLVVDEAARSVAAVGARLHSVSNCLNLGDPNRPEVMGQMDGMLRGFGEALRHLEVPTPSGNVSLYNEATKGPILPSLSVLGVGIIGDVRKAVSMDLKAPGQTIFLLGETRDELGGSTLYRMKEIEGGITPTVDLDALSASCEALVRAIEAGLVSAAHDVGDGGALVALAEMCIAGQLGADISTPTSDLPSDRLWFSESATRWIISTSDPAGFIAAWDDLPLVELGSTGGDALILDGDGIPVADLDSAWRSA